MIHEKAKAGLTTQITNIQQGRKRKRDENRCNNNTNNNNTGQQCTLIELKINRHTIIGEEINDSNKHSDTATTKQTL